MYIYWEDNFHVFYSCIFSYQTTVANGIDAFTQNPMEIEQYAHLRDEQEKSVRSNVCAQYCVILWR